jgi:tetratricopeptide (TPR) repeat protein
VVLNLSSAYLLNEENQAAQDLLKRNRRIWKEENFKATAELFDCLSRMRSKSRPGPGVMDEAEDALTRLTDVSLVGPAGIYLIGQIYQELEHPQETIKLYEKAVETGRGVLAIQMMRELGDYYFDNELHKKARSCYQAVMIVDNKANALHAKIRLAEISLHEEQFDESFQLCREVLRDARSQREAILPILGKVFEKKKDFQNAARCFAGLDPED